MKKIIIFLITGLLAASCTRQPDKTVADYVDPFIGTGGNGHTYPGATVPFGMVQLSPDTKTNDWDHCSGYQYDDKVILGFSLTHLSGTGVGDYGDFRFVPIKGKLKFYPGLDTGYTSQFRKETEKAQAGYYTVFLDNYDIKVELTATTRSGFQRYTFPQTNKAHILIDLKESITKEKVLDAEIRVLSNHEIMGYRHVDGWAKDRYIYFYADFSKPFQSVGIWDNGNVKNNLRYAKGTALKVFVNYKTKKGEQILVKTGISATGYQGAISNLKAEISNWNFDQVRKNAFNKWFSELSRIRVTSNNEKDKTIFYTALYHSFLAPNIYNDIDHHYRGHDKKIHFDDSFDMYTVFSLWDTFRALHPLFTIVQRKRTADIINSMLDMYKDDGLLPVWELAANETNCMIGYHSVSVIADAYKKGIRNFDAHLALQAMNKTASANRFGLQYYKTKGYIPADKEGESVSKTLEYAYDDWCIAQMAGMLHNDTLHNKFIKRAQYYKNIFDKKTGFFRGKSNGMFVTPFDPTQVNFMLTEANTWQYNFFVPEDINTLVEMLGGDTAFDNKLDKLFSSKGLSGRKQLDITGLIGQYAQGNEPSHNLAYLYNYVGEAWKTQKLVHKITTELYSDKPGGLAGNEDCGQMSAWYVFSAMGFYPVTPGSNIYVIGSPVFDTVKIYLENSNIFTIIANNVSEDNFYVQSARYNGKAYNKSFITENMIMNGGKLVFDMGNKPNKHWGASPEDRPYRKIVEDLITPTPYFKTDSQTFTTKQTVDIADLDPNAHLFYKFTNSDNKESYSKFIRPILIDKNTDIKIVAEKNGQKSFVEEARFYKLQAGRKVSYKLPYNKQYTAGGNNALIDGLRDSENFETGKWQGFHGNNLDIVIDLGKEQNVKRIGAEFLQDMPSYIFMPLWVRFATSTDGQHFEKAGTSMNTVDEHAPASIAKTFYSHDINKTIRYIHMIAKNRGICPNWHRGAGDKAWIFADEVWTE